MDTDYILNTNLLEDNPVLLNLLRDILKSNKSNEELI